MICSHCGRDVVLPEYVYVPVATPISVPSHDPLCKRCLRKWTAGWVP